MHEPINRDHLLDPGPQASYVLGGILGCAAMCLMDIGLIGLVISILIVIGSLVRGLN